MDPKSIVDWLTAAGPWAVAGAFFYWVKLERDERRASQARERKLSTEMLKAIIKSTNALRTLRVVLLHGRAPAPEEYEDEIEAEDAGGHTG